MGRYLLIKLKIGRYEQRKQKTNNLFYYMDFHLDFERGGARWFFFNILDN